MKKHVMLDIETMGNAVTSSIVSIGAVAFDENGLGDSFYVNVDLQSSIDNGLTIDGSTVEWWLQQSDSAKKDLLNEKESLDGALSQFECFLSLNTYEDVEIWGNGASFDNAILSNAYRSLKMAEPWKFWNNRCYRTMKNMFPHVEFKRVGTHHNAVDDAKSQALHLIEIFKLIK